MDHRAMTLRPTRSIVIASALLVTACGAGTQGVAKPDEATGAEAQRPITTAGSGPTIAARPATTDDLALRALGESPIGPIDADAAEAYGIELEVRNLSSTPITIAPAFVHVSVYRRSLALEGCRSPEPRAVELSPILAGGASDLVRVALPCPITEAGAYDVVLVLMTPRPDEAGQGTELNARTSTTMPLVVDDALPRYRSSLTAR